MKFSKCIYKGCDCCHGLISKAGILPFKQGYDSVRLPRPQSAVTHTTAQSGRQQHRNQSAVRTSHNVPSDSGNGANIFLNDMESYVFEVIQQHMTLCIDKLSLIRKLNNSPDGVKQYEIYAKEIIRLQKEQRRIVVKKNGLYEDYRDQLISAEELCQYKAEYEKQEEVFSKQIAEMKSRQHYYEKNFHMDEEWEQIVDRYLKKENCHRIWWMLLLTE